MPLQPRNRVGLLLVALLVSVTAAHADDTLIWSDEFDGTSLNLANWEYMIGDGSDYGLAGWGNNELEYYTSRPENVYVADGYLHIVAREESYAGFDYTSGRLRTLHKQDFRYGRIEARMTLPTGQGLWPAFWMLPTDSPYGGWASSGEIDIMESINVATTVYGTIHYGGSWPNNVSSGGSYSNGLNFANDFHTFTLEWEPDVMRWYVDGVFYHSESSATWYSAAAPSNDQAPFDQYFHILLNVAVGGNWPGYPNGTAVFPQEMVVDWVRVYELGAPPPQEPFYGDPLPVPGRIDAEDFDVGAEGEAYHDCDAGNTGGAYRPTAGVDIEACSEGGYNVGWMCSGEWIEYTVDVALPGLYTLAARVASDTTGGTLHVEFDGVNVTGPMQVPVTGGWQSWTTIEREVDLDAGEQIMRFANDSTSDEYNLNYFRLYYSADFDRDGDIDGADMHTFYGCVAGPEVTVAPSGCTAQQFAHADLDGDGDVDNADVGVFQQAFGL